MSEIAQLIEQKKKDLESISLDLEQEEFWENISVDPVKEEEESQEKKKKEAKEKADKLRLERFEGGITQKVHEKNLFESFHETYAIRCFVKEARKHGTLDRKAVLDEWKEVQEGKKQIPEIKKRTEILTKKDEKLLEEVLFAIENCYSVDAIRQPLSKLDNLSTELQGLVKAIGENTVLPYVCTFLWEENGIFEREERNDFKVKFYNECFEHAKMKLERYRKLLEKRKIRDVVLTMRKNKKLGRELPRSYFTPPKEFQF